MAHRLSRGRIWRPAAAALAMAVGGAVAAPTAASAQKGPDPADKAKPVKADKDRDKVFDDLEARLAGAPADAKAGVIVTLNAPASPSAVDSLKRGVGDFPVGHRYSVINGFSASLKKGQIEALARRGDVAQVEEDSPVHATNASAQASFGVTEARADNGNLDGGDGVSGYSAGDLVAAVIDTGIDAAHQDLDGGKVLGWVDYVAGRTTPYDDNDHGTHVAGTIAGDGSTGQDGQGVAPAAGLVGLKVLDYAGNGSMSNVTAAIDWVVANKATFGIEAINLSLGTSGCSDGTDATSLAVNRAHNAGIVVAVAAGNSGSGTCTIGSPGAATGALTVGAMADMGAGGFKQAYFSSRGKTADGRIEPDISAPGVNINSADANTVNGLRLMSGTSMATPFVAGVSLLMLDANPGRTPPQVHDAMITKAQDWGRGGDNRTGGTRGRDIDYGAGRLDSYAALGTVDASLTSPPAVPNHGIAEGSLSGSGAYRDYWINVTDTRFPVAVTLIHSSVSGGTSFNPDFDLYLYNPSGTLVARAETIRRQEDVSFQPTATGWYRLRVRSYKGSGGFFVDVSAGF